MITKQDIVDFLSSVGEDPSLSKMTNPRSETDINLCKYQDGQGNHCIVGYWLHHNIGIDDDWMDSNIEGESAANAIYSARESGFIDDIEPEAVDVLLEAQASADKWRTDDNDVNHFPNWGEVIEELGL